MLHINAIRDMLERFTYKPGVKITAIQDSPFGQDVIRVEVSGRVLNPDDPDKVINNGYLKLTTTQCIPPYIDDPERFWLWLDRVIGNFEDSKRWAWMRVDGNRLFNNAGDYKP